MKNQHIVMSLLGIVAFLWVVTVFAQGPDTVWTRTYGQPGDYYSDDCYSVEQTFDGGYMVAGWTESFGAVWCDVYLMKTDANGNSLWIKTYGGAYTDLGHSAQQTSDSGYVIAGETSSFGTGGKDVYLIKTDSCGDTLWTRTYGGREYDNGWSVRETRDGGYIVVGETRSYGAGDTDVYLIKTNASGGVIWTKTYGGNQEDRGYSVQQTTDGGYIVVGHTKSFGAGGKDIYLIKTNRNGDILWAKTYGEPNSDRCFSVQQTSDGGYIATGCWADDVCLLKTTAYGDTLWTRTYGGINSDLGLSVQETSGGGYIIAGLTYSFGPDIPDVYLIKTDSCGDTLWTRTYGGSGDDGARSVQQTAGGGYIVGGWKNSDIYLIKMGPETGIKEQEFSQESFFIFRNRPNPFADRTLIKYELQQTSTVHIAAYNLLGQEVRTLLNTKQNTGMHTVIWDATDNSGRRVPSGPYFLRLEAGEHTATRKLCVIR